MGRTLLVIGVAAVTCLLALWLVAPRLLSPGFAPAPPNPASGNSNSSANASADSLNPAASSSPASPLPPITASGTPGETALPNIAPLQTPEQKAITDYEAQRAPFYAFLRDKCGALVVDARPAPDDRSILSLYCARSDNRIVTDILTQIVNPYAYAYGFRHVRFYLPNAPGGVERYRLAAEANAESEHNWQAFQK